MTGRIIAPGSAPTMADHRFRSCPLAVIDEPAVTSIVTAHRRELRGRGAPAPHLLQGVDQVAAAHAEKTALELDRIRDGGA